MWYICNKPLMFDNIYIRNIPSWKTPGIVNIILNINLIRLILKM